MKFLITLFTILTISLTSFGQTVKGTPLKDVDVQYIQIVGTGKLLSNKVTVEIDFGQENKFFSGKDAQILDESGKPVVFNSMIDALNFMSSNGYEFVTAYAITISNQNVYHYLLRKSK
jgi:hypothetical protein